MDKHRSFSSAIFATFQVAWVEQSEIQISSVSFFSIHYWTSVKKADRLKRNILRTLRGFFFQAGCSVNKIDNTYNECVKRRQPPLGRKQKQIENGFSYPTRHWISNNWIYSFSQSRGNWDQQKTFQKLSVTGASEEIDCAFMPQEKAPTPITPTCLSLLPSRLQTP